MVNLVENEDKRRLPHGSGRFAVKIKNYLFKNLGAPFILVFNALILVVAYMIVQGNSFVNELAVLAYCFLVVGVILQAICYLRYKSDGK